MAPTTQKALLLESKQGSFKISDVDVPKPGPNQVLVRILATALNPVDWKIQSNGSIVTEFPAVLGTDGAGIVEELGPDVTNFKVGDKIITEGTFHNQHATFQQYFVANADVSARVPDNVSLDAAASIPVGLATAAIGLYNVNDVEKSAALAPPWEKGGEGKFAGKPLFVFGGASSVGQFAIQLGKLSGFSPIITTASLHNTDLLKSLGATHVIDRNISGATFDAQVKKITSNPFPIVYDAISYPETQNAGYDLLAPGGTIVIVLFDAIDPAKRTPERRIVHVFGQINSPENRKLGQSLYSKLSELLEKGAIKPNRVEALPSGLAGIPDGLQRLKENKVSGVKLVAHPQDTA